MFVCQLCQCKFHITLDSNMYVFGGVNSLPLPPYRVTTLTSSLNSVTTTINFYSREDPSLDLNNSITSIKSRAVIGAMNILKCNSHIAVLDSKIYVWCSVHPDYYSKTFG